MMISCETRSHISRACFRSLYWLHEKHPHFPTSPRPDALCLTHIKQSIGMSAQAFVLTVCTHIICHSAPTVNTARRGHQLPLLCVKRGGASFLIPLHHPPATTIPHGEEATSRAEARWQRCIQLKYALRAVSLCSGLHSATPVPRVTFVL